MQAADQAAVKAGFSSRARVHITSVLQMIRAGSISIALVHQFGPTFLGHSLGWP